MELLRKCQKSGIIPYEIMEAKPTELHTFSTYFLGIPVIIRTAIFLGQCPSPRYTVNINNLNFTIIAANSPMLKL